LDIKSGNFGIATCGIVFANMTWRVLMARILLHTLVFSPDGVSTAYLMRNLAARLAELGHTVTVLTTTPHYNLEPQSLNDQPLHDAWRGWVYRSTFQGINVWHVKIPMKGQRVWARALDYLRFHILALFLGMFAVGKYEIVISPSPPLTMGIIGWLLALWRWVPCIYNVQEVYPDVAVNQGLIRNRILIGCLKLMERFVYRRSTAIVPIADGFGRLVAQRGAERLRIVTIPNFVDTRLYKPHPRDNVLACQHRLVDKFVVMYGGNLGLSQDWESLLYAAEELRAEPIEFVLVGGGARQSWLEEEIERRGLRNVRLLGYHPESAMPLLYSAADLVTIPMKTDTTRDTLPSKVFATMACARPLLVSADEDSDFRRIVLEAQCGRVVAPDDPQSYALAVRQAFQQRTVLPREGEAGLAYVTRGYTKEAVAQQYDDLIRQLVDKAA
jgi:colanic acid biosynthesis glycosyl transferase WcaI